jgi:hypothetical protein
MGSSREHEEGEIEGVVKVAWCVESFGWSCKRQWVRRSTGSSYAPWIAHIDHLWIPADDFADRNFTKLITGAAQTARNLEVADRAGHQVLSM